MEYLSGYADFSGTMTRDFTFTFSPVSNEADVCAGQHICSPLNALSPRHHRTWTQLSNPESVSDFLSPITLLNTARAKRSNWMVSLA